MKRTATTVEAYLEDLPASQRPEIEGVLALVRAAIPKGYQEGLGFGMICWTVPLSVYSDTYNGHPLMGVALAGQKNHCALYLMGVYGDPLLEKALRKAFKTAGKKLDMGKACLRFSTVAELVPKAVSAAIAAVPPSKLVAAAEAARAGKARRNAPATKVRPAAAPARGTVSPAERSRRAPARVPPA